MKKKEQNALLGLALVGAAAYFLFKKETPAKTAPPGGVGTGIPSGDLPFVNPVDGNGGNGGSGGNEIFDSWTEAELENAFGSLTYDPAHETALTAQGGVAITGPITVKRPNLAALPLVRLGQLASGYMDPVYMSYQPQAALSGLGVNVFQTVPYSGTSKTPFNAVTAAGPTQKQTKSALDTARKAAQLARASDLTLGLDKPSAATMASISGLRDAVIANAQQDYLARLAADKSTAPFVTKIERVEGGTRLTTVANPQYKKVSTPQIHQAF